MDLRFWAATDVGRVRNHNEDNFLVDKRLQLFVVCDGMGGHAAGEVASAVCVRTVRDVIAAESDLLARMRENPGDPMGRQVLEDLLGRAIRTACARIFEMAQQDASRRGMGTTCIALVLAGNRGFVGHVGDSRLYRLRNDEIEQISNDHSLLNEMIRQGKLPADTSEENFPHNNAVTRAVGVRESVEVDTFQFEVQAGDRLLMCSDGLSEYFRRNVDLLDLMGSDEPKVTTQRCIEHANNSGGKDNITVIVVDCGVEDDDAQGKEESARAIEILRNTAYFHYLAPPELEQIRKMAIRVEYDADTQIIGEERPNDKLFIILKGSVSLQLEGRQLSVLTTGEHFGEMALIDAQDEQDTRLVARTLEPTVMLTIVRDQFVSLLRTTPGLAIKLLWNFVQVFADRLQSVPPEFRFTPDEWRQEPEVAADLTPPSGSLVYKEDLKRVEAIVEQTPLANSMSSLSDNDPIAQELEAARRAERGAEDGYEDEAVGNGGLHELVNDDFESRKTIDLGEVDLSQIGAAPPKAGPALSAADLAGTSGEYVFGQADEDEDDDEDHRSVRKGLTSGTYDQRLLAGGVSGTMDFDDDGRNSSEARDPNRTLAPWELDAMRAQTKDAPESESPAEEPEEPASTPLERRETMKLDFALSRDGGKDSKSDDEDLAATVDISADVERLRELKAQSQGSGALKDKLRDRMKDRAAPPAEVLRKARTTQPTKAAPKSTPPPLKKTPPLPAAESRPSAPDASDSVSGESQVSSSNTPPPPAVAEPKVMISPDLMADLDDE